MTKKRMIITLIVSFFALMLCAYLINIFTLWGSYAGFFQWLIWTICYDHTKLQSISFKGVLFATIDLGIRSVILITLVVIIIKHNVQNIKKYKEQENYKYELSKKKSIALLIYSIFLILAYIFKVIANEIERNIPMKSVIEFIINFDWENILVYATPILLEILCIVLLFIKSIKNLKAIKKKEKILINEANPN